MRLEHERVDIPVNAHLYMRNIDVDNQFGAIVVSLASHKG
jgi:hypothetical protein